MAEKVIVNVASQVAGVGMAVPSRVVPNEYFSTYLETSDEWIRARTGIGERRWAEPGVSASELAEPAARQAMTHAGLGPADIDGIILATVTPDYVFPSTACMLQHRLGIKRGFAYDVNAVCSGFIYALVTADALISKGLCKNVLVVGTELYSRILNPHDRGTVVLFGDGAGALVLSGVHGSSDMKGKHGGDFEVSGSSKTVRGIYGSELGADGAMTQVLCVPAGTARPVSPESLQKGEHYLTMNGREVFKSAVRTLSDVCERLMARLGIPMSEVDHFVSHQANRRILEAVGKQLSIPSEKVLMNVEKYGNTSAASLPILLAEASAAGTLKPGDLVLLSAFGGGFTWGAVLVRW